MPERPAYGPTGLTVAANVRRLRTERNLGYTELSRRLADINRPIPVLGLRRIEEETRRVDADDLVALAIVLGVSPATLLMPTADAEEAMVDATGAEGVEAGLLWSWLTCEPPLTTKAPGWEKLRLSLENKPEWAQSSLARAGLFGRDAPEMMRTLSQWLRHQADTEQPGWSADRGDD